MSNESSSVTPVSVNVKNRAGIVIHEPKCYITFTGVDFPLHLGIIINKLCRFTARNVYVFVMKCFSLLPIMPTSKVGTRGKTDNRRSKL